MGVADVTDAPKSCQPYIARCCTYRFTIFTGGRGGLTNHKLCAILFFSKSSKHDLQDPAAQERSSFTNSIGKENNSETNNIGVPSTATSVNKMNPEEELPTTTSNT